MVDNSQKLVSVKNLQAYHNNLKNFILGMGGADADGAAGFESELIGINWGAINNGITVTNNYYYFKVCSYSRENKHMNMDLYFRVCVNGKYTRVACNIQYPHGDDMRAQLIPERIFFESDDAKNTIVNWRLKQMTTSNENVRELWMVVEAAENYSISEAYVFGLVRAGEIIDTTLEAKQYGSYTFTGDSLNLTMNNFANKTTIGNISSHATGEYSAVFGKSCRAEGEYSFAAGYGAKSYSEATIALGSNVVAGVESGTATGATALGCFTKSTATGSFTAGLGQSASYPTLASADAAVAMGYLTQATAKGAVAMGQGGYNSSATDNAKKYRIITASGEGAIAMGYHGDGSNYLLAASGKGSIALGYGTVATAEGAIGVGHSSQSKGKGAFAAGYYAKATEQGSVAIGYDIASAYKNGVAIGPGTKTNKEGQIALGSYNANDTTSLLVIGGGTSSKRATVFTLGQEGTRSNVATDGVTIGYLTSNHYTKNEIDSIDFNSKVDLSNYYTKNEVYTKEEVVAYVESKLLTGVW